MAEKTNITFLGTGSAIPTARRNHPAVLLTYKNENILIDCGEGTQRQFRKVHLNPCKITKILITHWHADHVLGLPGLLQTLMLNGYNRTLKIYGPRGTKEKLALYLGLFIHKGSKLDLEVHEASSGTFIDEKEFQIQAEEMNHDAPSLAYSLVIKEKQRLNRKKLTKLKIPNSPLLAELAKGKTVTINNKKVDGKKLIYTELQRKITIIMDTLPNPNTIKLAKDSDLLICESTYSSAEKDIARDHNHLTSEDAAEIAKKSKSKKLLLTHLSQRYDTKEGQAIILGEAKKVFKDSEVAQDLMILEI